MAEPGRPSRWRAIARIAGGLLMNTAVLVTPGAAQVGVADTTDEMKHFWRHFIKRRVTLLGDSRWLGMAGKATDADKLDGLDSAGFYLFGSKVADAEKLDGLDSAGFYLFGSKVADADKLDGLDSTGFYLAGSKVADSQLLDGIDSTGFLRTTGKAADSEKLDGIDSTGFLRTTGKAADSEKLDGIDSAGFYLAGSKVADSERLDGLDSSGFYLAGSKVDDSQKLDGLDSTDFQRSCRDGSVKVFAIIDGTHDDLVADGPFVTAPVVRSFNCTGDPVRVRRTPTNDGGLAAGDYQVDIGKSISAVFACPEFVVQSTAGPHGRSEDRVVNNIGTVGYVRDCPNPPCAVITDCYAELEVQDKDGGWEDSVFTITIY